MVDLNDLRDESYMIARDKGWHDREIARSTGDILALIHSEISEILEDVRDGHSETEIFYTKKVKVDYFDPATQKYTSGTMEVRCLPGDKDAKPCGIPSEVADVLIRLLDYCGSRGIDIQKAYEVKTAYNRTRPWRHGGKKL